MHDRCSVFGGHKDSWNFQARGKEHAEQQDFAGPTFHGTGALRPEATRRAPLTARLIARLRASHFDRQLAVGVPAPAGSAISVHQMRLTSITEREAVARALRRTVRDARSGINPLTSRVPLHPTNITDAEDVIDKVTLRLHSPQPVSARGMARLRLLLADGCGPMYRFGQGDLRGRLGAALAAL